MRRSRGAGKGREGCSGKVAETWAKMGGHGEGRQLGPFIFPNSPSFSNEKLVFVLTRSFPVSAVGKF